MGMPCVLPRMPAWVLHQQRCLRSPLCRRVCSLTVCTLMRSRMTCACHRTSQRGCIPQCPMPLSIAVSPRSSQRTAWPQCIPQAWYMSTPACSFLEWQSGMGQLAACPSAGLPRSVRVTRLPAAAAPAAQPAAPPRTPRAPCTQAAAGPAERPQSAPPAAPLSPRAHKSTPAPPASGAPCQRDGTAMAPSPCAPCKRKRGAHAAAAAHTRELQSSAARMPGAALLPLGQLEPGASTCSRKTRRAALPPVDTLCPQTLHRLRMPTRMCSKHALHVTHKT